MGQIAMTAACRDEVLVRLAARVGLGAYFDDYAFKDWLASVEIIPDPDRCDGCGAPATREGFVLDEGDLWYCHACVDAWELEHGRQWANGRPLDEIWDIPGKERPLRGPRSRQGGSAK